MDRIGSKMNERRGVKVIGGGAWEREIDEENQRGRESVSKREGKGGS